jgi:hypothetical protein
MSDDALEPRDPALLRWRLPFSLLGLIALAWIVYEATHSPALASFFVSLKFAWEDIRTANWLRRNDLVKSRGASLFWLYVSWGVWKSAAVAFLMSLGFLLVAASDLRPPVVRQAMLALFGTGLTAIVCFSVSALLTAVAFVVACRGGVRLWLDSAVHRARRQDCWPPTPYCEGRVNRIGSLPLAGLGLSVLLMFLFFLAVGPPRGRGEAALLGFFLSLVTPTAIGVSRILISHTVEADSPAECWPEQGGLPEP